MSALLPRRQVRRRARTAATLVLSAGMLASAMVAFTPHDAAWAAERPDFQLPFPCGQKWSLFSYEAHNPADKKIDMTRIDGRSKGSPAVAAAAGVVHEHIDTDGNGKPIGGLEIDHGNGWFSLYLHMTMRSRVPVGTRVKQGDRVGTVDNVGTGVHHLHYEQLFDANGDDDGESDEIVYSVFNGVRYNMGAKGQKAYRVTSRNSCDGQPPPPPAEKKSSEVAYAGPESVSNGSPVQLSAELSDEDEKGVGDREVSFALGSGESAQKCAGTTNADGKASCTIDEVDQPLGEDAAVPLAVKFAGDDDYKASEDSAKLKLQYFSGRAFGAAADVPLLGLPIGVEPTPDTGTVRAAGKKDASPSCAQSVDALALVSVDVLCAEVKATTGPSSVTATASVQDTEIGVPGLPLLSVQGARARSTSSCETSSGGVDVALEVAGTPVEVGDLPNQEIPLDVAGTRLVVNEHTKTADGGLRVNALHLTAPGGVDVVLASAATTAHNCT